MRHDDASAIESCEMSLLTRYLEERYPENEDDPPCRWDYEDDYTPEDE